MRLVNSRPRYHCDYCRKILTKDAMERHEIICWKNPNRFCASCNNTGFYPGEEVGLANYPCYFCSQRDRQP